MSPQNITFTGKEGYQIHIEQLNETCSMNLRNCERLVELIPLIVPLGQLTSGPGQVR